MPILTRRLREFLEHPEAFSPGYRRYLRHLLRHRISMVYEELEYINEKAPKLLEEIESKSLARGRSRVQIPPGPLTLNIIELYPKLFFNAHLFSPDKVLRLFFYFG